MAATDAQRFLERLMEDASLRAELRSAGAATVDNIADFALVKGFVFTQQDLKSALASFPDSPFTDQLRERLKISKVAHSR